MRVFKTEDHWLWIGHAVIHSNGHYGRLRTKVGPQPWVQAHRMSWEIHNGPIGDGLVVRHLCGNTLCVRPDHLAVGTVQDNIDDRGRDGNTACGSKHYMAKLTEADVVAIRKSTELHRVIADRYGISKNSVSRIKCRKAWKHVP